ncbi:IS1634 family transposase [Oceanivirga salmonicida]|uniref:IS1634 family transposase n=1 Tax=Oceanivirga salmonicida TaxID=1769291 RepID=UPI00082E7CEB|nr:transposase [Oceanivirga salmonicida]
MFLEICKSKNITYLYKAQYVTIAKGRYKRVRELLGRLDELEKIYDDPVTHFRKELELQTKLEKENKKNNEINLSFSQEKININDLVNKTLIDETLEKNIGSLIIQHIYHKLNLDILLKKIQIKENTKIKMSKLLQLLIICRCLYPNSKLSDFRHKDNFADTFNLSRDDIYRGLEILNKYKDEIISHFNNNISNLINYDLSNAHYDLTNYFVYTDDTTYLIKKGYSKVKNGKPIIQQALLTDANGLPINYQLFSGNRNDVSTLIDFLDTQKKRFNIKNTTIVADAGLVSNDNIVKILLSKNQYIFKESMLRINENIMASFDNIVKPKLEYIMSKNEKLKGCYFSLVLNFELKVLDIYGKTKKVSVPQRYIFMYSKKFDEKHKRVRMDQLENVDKYISDTSKLKDKMKKVIPNLIKIDTTKTNIEIDQEKLDKYEKTSGYSLIITSNVKTYGSKDEYVIPDSEIINMYKMQYLIEESFKICKTNLDIDNIYLKREDRIEEHFLTGFLSLAFLRILQQYLANEYSIANVQETLKEFKINKLRNTNYYQLSTINMLNAKLQNNLDISINQNIYDGKEIRSLIGNLKKN